MPASEEEKKRLHAERERTRYWENPEYYRAKAAERRDPEKARVYAAQYRRDNPDKIKESQKKSREKNAETCRKWRQNNPDKVKEYKKREWKERGTEINEERRARRQNDPAYAEAIRQRRREDYTKKIDVKRAQAAAYREANPELVKLWRQANRQKRRAAYLLYGVRRSAKESGVPFDLTVEWIQKRLDAGVCEMSGESFDMEGKRAPNSPSVDRVVPGGPYTQANCRLILWSINRALNNYGQDYMIRLFRKIIAQVDADPGAKEAA